MKAPDIESDQEYFDLNKADWDLADPNQVPKEGDQVVVECFSLPMFEPLTEENMFRAHYYRAKFVSIDEESQYCELKTLADSHFSIMKVDCLRVVPKEKVWEV
jgi:hypothetical protein